jgi:6-pyruvoyltetrahydropterin/6-carboxytetrahydropterin synthase
VFLSRGIICGSRTGGLVKLPEHLPAGCLLIRHLDVHLRPEPAPGKSPVNRTKMVYLTRIEHFNAAHKLYNTDWTREKNAEVFGKCANENWHGHNFELLVTVKGQPDPGTGFIVDAKLLSRIIRDHIIEKLDHRNLNLDVDFMKGKMCSIENLVTGIWNELKPLLPQGVILHSIRLVETPRIYVEYFGELQG